MSFAFVPAIVRLGRTSSACARFALLAAVLCAGFLTHAPHAQAQALSALPANVHNAGYLISSVATQTDGKTVVSGVFSEIGTTPMTNIARFNTDGTLDTTFVAPQTDAFFQHMAISGNVLYVTGQFSTINGSARQRIAAINLLDGSLMGWNPAPDGDVTALAVSGGILYVGGTFSHIAGAARNSLAAFTLASNTITSWNPNATSSSGPDVISAIQPAGSSVYLAGYFDSVGGQPRLFLAQVDSAGGAVSAWNPQQSAYGFPMSLAYYNGTVFVGGEMQIGGNWYGLAALDGSSGALKWGENNGDVYDLWLNGTTVYADGAFTALGGAARAGLGAFDATNGAATPWNPVTVQPSDPVRVLGQSGAWLLLGGGAQAFDGAWTGPFIRVDTGSGAVGATTPVRYRALVNALLQQADGKVLVGGRFTEINGVARHNVARLNADGSVDANWNPGASFDVNALGATPNVVYIASASSEVTIGGQARKYLGAVDAVSGAATPWNPTPDSDVLTLLVANNQLYVSGFFTSIGGAQRAGLASFDAASGTLTPFTAQPDGRVLAMAYHSGTLYVGGDFAHVSSQARTLLAALDANSGNVATWDPGALSGIGYAVEALAVNGTQLLVGGNFQSMGGIVRPNLVGLNFSTARATAWTPGAVNGAVDAIVPGNGVFYIGGGFSTIAGAQRTYLAALDAGSGALQGNWAPFVDNGVYTLAASNGRVFVGGGFTWLGAAARNALGAFGDVDMIFADGFE